MNSRGTSHYDILVQAVQTVNKELGFFTDESVDEDDNPDLDREIRFLSSSLDYYYTNGIYPFGTTRVSEDFSNNWVGLTLDQFVEENQKLRKRYKGRVRKVCKKGQLLEPREQEAFEMANKIWGSRSGGKREDHHQDLILKAGDHGSGRGEVEQEDPLAQSPLLMETFKLGINISNDLKIPVSSYDVVKRGLATLESAKMKEWNEKWKKIQVDELKIFLEKINMIRQQTLFLLAEIDILN